jgi:hypothetical protein
MGNRDALLGAEVRISFRMTNNWLNAARAIGIAVAIGGIAGLAGCASERGGGTAALEETSPVQGRDLGRGGATSGGLSSLDWSGNAADYSVYDARQVQQGAPR